MLLDLENLNLRVEIEETTTKIPSLIVLLLQQYQLVLAATLSVLIEKCKEDVESKGLQNQVVATACSQVVGHKYARNVIILSAD